MAERFGGMLREQLAHITMARTNSNHDTALIAADQHIATTARWLDQLSRQPGTRLVAAIALRAAAKVLRRQIWKLINDESTCPHAGPAPRKPPPDTSWIEMTDG